MKIRIKFGKYGELKFIGHLDVMRYFQKLMRRADIDICYSKGFSPHQIMSFAQPLGIGVTSDGEYFDIEAHSTLSTAEAVKRLNEFSVPNLPVYDYRLLPDDAKTGMAVIAAADYIVRPRYPERVYFDIKKTWGEFMAQETILIDKKTSAGEEELDMKTLIYENEADEGSISFRLSCGSVINLKPETVMEKFFEFVGYEPAEFELIIHRKELYAAAGDGFISLGDMGTVIEKGFSEDDKGDN
ncbi:MAG: TIGR03936 family radical SAM-associated protein [Lachnospiraceae bacterium]|nr:TIGR03936 family radical SAM-associated protein [Lachnospiraceae bacterium]